MATYLILNIVFMAVVLLLLRARPHKPSWRWWILLAIMLVMTAVFDTLIIASGSVRYYPDKILGLYIGRAPVEDFAYTLLAAIIVPLIWNRQKGGKPCKR